MQDKDQHIDKASQQKNIKESTKSATLVLIPISWWAGFQQQLTGKNRFYDTWFEIFLGEIFLLYGTLTM